MSCQEADGFGVTPLRTLSLDIRNSAEAVSRTLLRTQLFATKKLTVNMSYDSTQIVGRI